MADFDLWGRVLAPAFGFPTLDFMADYARAIGEKWQDAVESDPLAESILSLLDNLDGEWSGTASELLFEISRQWPEIDEGSGKVTKVKSFPNSARELGRALKRLAPALRQLKVEVSWTKSGPRRLQIQKL